MSKETEQPTSLEPGAGSSRIWSEFELLELLTTNISRIVQMKTSEIGLDTNFSDLGFDSVDAAELSVSIESALNMQFDPSLLWSFTTIRELAEHFCKIVLEERQVTEPPGAVSLDPAPASNKGARATLADRLRYAATRPRDPL